MKKIFTTADTLLVGYVSSVLEAEGIRTFVTNEHLSGGVGELPASECWPELWIVEADDVARAERILGEFTALADGPTQAGSPWQCPQCGEQLEPQFTDCWNCNGGTLIA